MRRSSTLLCARAARRRFRENRRALGTRLRPGRAAQGCAAISAGAAPRAELVQVNHESTARGPEAQTVRDIAAIDGCFKLWLEVSNRSSLIARSVGKHVVPSRSNTNPTREGNRSWRISKACVYDLINTTARTSKSAAMVLFLQRTRQPQRCAGTYAARYSLGRDFDVVEATTPKLMLKYDRTAQPVDPGST